MPQLMKSVTPMPRQCSFTRPSAAKSIFRSIGTIISQMSRATGRFTFATSSAAMDWKRPGIRCPSVTPAMMQRNTQTVR